MVRGIPTEGLELQYPWALLLLLPIPLLVYAQRRYVTTTGFSNVALLGRDLAARLCALLGERGADIAVAHDGERLQPTFALIRRSLSGSLESYIAAGERKIDRWYARHEMVTADCSDIAASFANVNDPAERAAIEEVIMRTG